MLRIFFFIIHSVMYISSIGTGVDSDFYIRALTALMNVKIVIL